MQPPATAMNSIARRKPPKPRNAAGASGSFDAILKIEMIPRGARRQADEGDHRGQHPRAENHDRGGQRED